MKTNLLSLFGGLVAASVVGVFTSPTIASAQSAVVDSGYEELTRGPVHEAFAESVSFEPEPGMIVTTAPPDLIDELPPEVQPEGDNVEWISGYWMWDDDRSDYLWISGVWRDLPPSRQWVPGYWDDLSGGQWQWVGGYWEDTDRQVVDYISTAPPESLERGPSVRASSSDQTWIPGNWIWADTSYNWRPGYWSPLRSGWTWVPSRYVWTPRGYIFVDGYWDYEVARRGVLFAPVHFAHRSWQRPGFNYRPSLVVSLNVFRDYLFYRPRASHYYFGDYYDSRYRTRGYDPSFVWHNRRGHYDPIYAYQRWHHRDDRNWDRQRRERFEYLARHADARPPHTWSAMRQLRDRRGNDASIRNQFFASTLANYANDGGRDRRFQKVSDSRLKRIVDQRRETRSFADRRQKLESSKVDRRQAVSRLKDGFARSPIQGRRAADRGKGQRPPQRLEPGAARLREQVAKRNDLARKSRGEATAGPKARPSGPGGRTFSPEARKAAQRNQATERRNKPSNAARESAQRKAREQAKGREQVKPRPTQQRPQPKAKQGVRTQPQKQQIERAKAQRAEQQRSAAQRLQNQRAQQQKTRTQRPEPKRAQQQARPQRQQPQRAQKPQARSPQRAQQQAKPQRQQPQRAQKPQARSPQRAQQQAKPQRQQPQRAQKPQARSPQRAQQPKQRRQMQQPQRAQKPQARSPQRAQQPQQRRQMQQPKSRPDPRKKDPRGGR